MSHDIVILRNKKSALIFAKTRKAQIEFDISFVDVYKRDNGETFILRSPEQADDIKDKYLQLGFSIKEE